MKKKYLIELEEIRLNSNQIWLRESYRAPGSYLAIDEKEVKSIIIVPENNNSGVIGLPDLLPPNNMIEQFLGKPLEEFPETKELEAIPELITGIDGATLIRAIAVAQNPELIKDMDL